MAYIAKGAPFRFKGAVNVENCITSEDVIKQAKLDWQVDKCPLAAKIDVLGDNQNFDMTKGFIKDTQYYTDLDNCYATYRTDHNIPLGNVKGKYTPVQNTEAFKFFDDAIGKDKAIWQTAGSFGNGERIFVSAKLPNTIVVDNDPVDNYLVFTNSHDGSSGVKVLFTPIRVICQNTLNAAIRTSTNFVSFRHTKNVHDKISIADQLLGICKKMSNYLEEQYTALLNTKYTDDEAYEVFGKVILSESEMITLAQEHYNVKAIANRYWKALNDCNISAKKVNTLHDIVEYYHTGIGQEYIVGTGWGVYNAVSGYYSNVDNATDTKRMDSLLYGDKSNKIKNTANIILQ